MYDAAVVDPAAEARAGRGRRPGDRRRRLAAGGARRRQPDGAQRSTASASTTCARRSAPPTPTGRRASSPTATQAVEPRHRPTSCCSAERVPAAHHRATGTAPPCGSPTSPTSIDSVEDVRTAGFANGKPAVMVIIFRQPGANIIETVDRIRALLPQLAAAIPRGDRPRGRDRPHADDPRLGARRRAHAA